MTGKLRAYCLGGASALAIGSGPFLLTPDGAQAACNASANAAGGLNILCDGVAPPTAPFQTSVVGDGYDGDLADSFDLNGDTIAVGGANGTPTVGNDGPLTPGGVGVPAIHMLGGDDQVIIESGTIGLGAPVSLYLGDGSDRLTMSGGTLNGDVFGDSDGDGPGADTFNVSGGTISGSIFANELNDIVNISGTAHIGIGLGGPDLVGLEAGNDTFAMTGGTLDGAVSGGLGDDQLTVNGGTVGGFLAGNEGNDSILVNGGTILDDVRGNEGTDSVTISGGTISGNVEGETVTLNGGTIGGDIEGISGNTLIINGTAVPLVLRDGVVFSGTNAVAIITNEDLARGGAFSQIFTGFNSVSASGSTLGFRNSTQGIGQLLLTNGSTLFSSGGVFVPGTVTATGSTISMINGSVGDVFSLGGLALNGATLGIDISQQALQADQIVAGAFSATGANTILVNLIGTPQLASATDIPIIFANGASIAGFSARGVPGTVGSLFTYQVLANGTGLILRAIPTNVGVIGAPASAVNAGTVGTVLDALYSINRDAIDADLLLANGGAIVALTDTFGVFASGQFAHTAHNGFDMSLGNFTVQGPDFDADDFSAALSFDFNAAKHFGFDDRYGLNIGVFAGYASTDVGLGAFGGFPTVGYANNRSGMVGAYGLFRQDVNYALVSATGFFGNSDVTNEILNSTGSYDTTGYAVTGSVGRIFAIGERARFDLRGGLLGVAFEGDPFTDSVGIPYGESNISFGGIRFEPGVYADYQLESGMTLSPYARGEVQQRFAYRNTVDIATREIDFDDADFSVALSTGFNLKMNETATLSGEVRGKASSDATTLGGKLGVKVAF